MKPRTELGREFTDIVLKRLVESLPEHSTVLLVGNTAALMLEVPDITRTKDIDVSLILLRGKREVATYEMVREFLGNLGGDIEKDPEDHSWTRVLVQVEDRSATVEIIRGKSRDRPRGKFISRNVLQAVAQAAKYANQVLVPSLTDLIVMKAWAVVDKSRSILEDPENQYHSLRREAYYNDARRITELALDRIELDRQRINDLLNLMKGHRRDEVRAILEEVGALEAGPNGV